MCSFLKKLFSKEKEKEKQDEPKEDIVICNKWRCLYIKGEAGILIVPGTILHIHLSGQMHKSGNQNELDIVGRYVSCNMVDKKILLTIDVSSNHNSSQRTITIYPRSWDGFTDVWVNGFHINYNKPNVDMMQTEIREMITLRQIFSDGTMYHRTYLTGTEVDLVSGDCIDDISGKTFCSHTVGRLTDIARDTYLQSFEAFIDCSEDYKSKTYHPAIRNIYNLTTIDDFCVNAITDSSVDTSYKTVTAIMDIEINSFLDLETEYITKHES